MWAAPAQDDEVDPDDYDEDEDEGNEEDEDEEDEDDNGNGPKWYVARRRRVCTPRSS